MVSRLARLILPLACLLCAALAPAGSALAAWTTVGNGIEYQQFTLPDPNNIFVARMTRANELVTIESSIGNGRVSGNSREVMTAQAARYDDVINWWGKSWGQRNDVVVAVNGDFFNGTTGVITGGQCYSCWYAKRFGDWGGYSAFGWTTNRVPFFGGCIYHKPAEQYIYYPASGYTQQFQGVNTARGANQLILYTPQYDTTTLTDATGIEVLVEVSRPSVIINSPNYTSGYVRQIRQNQGSTPIPWDHVVLSATDTAATNLLNHVSIGAEVRITQYVTDYNEPDTSGNNGCNTPTHIDWQKTYAAVGINYRFLEGGVVRPPDPAHEGYAGLIIDNPRTVVAYNADYVFFIVVDGRSANSIGMDMTELGNFCKNTLGATDGANLDGGGSSTMVVNGVLKNVPSDGSQRAVCNGLLMVNLLPKLQSTNFVAGQSIFAAGDAEMRLGPGTNYAVLVMVASGTQGTIVDHALKGVYAKGKCWWKVTIGGYTGWVAETSLASNAIPPSITQHPQPQTVCAGETATFTVTATGTAPLSYQWQKNDGNLSNGGHYSNVTTPTLTVSSVDANDVADYKCVVTNAFGTATSNTAALSLQTPGTVSFNLPAGCWHLFSLPCDPSDPAPEAVFPPGTPLDGNLTRYQPGGYITYSSLDPSEFGQMQAGAGYWIYASDPINISYTGCCPPHSQELPYPIAGWYMIGGHQSGDVALSGCSVRNSSGQTLPFAQAWLPNAWVADPLYYYDCANLGYLAGGVDITDNDTDLRQFRGYWLTTLQPNLTLVVPSP